MTAMVVKICGITNLEDGLFALEAGADMLGFNFYSASPRCLVPAECARIVSRLRESGALFQAVGVFVDQSLNQIETLLDLCELNLAQLSGNEPPQTLAALESRAFKALHPANGEALLRDLGRYSVRPKAPGYLVDTFRPGEYGGTGQLADWGLASELARRHPILLAGGLRPDNVAAAIRQVRPWGVDVASGVEASPGRKDPAKILAFLQVVRDTYKELVHAEHPLEG